jgi:hypothetical protein
MDFETLTYDAADGIAWITLNRPQQLNTIVPPMPQELEAAVHRASLAAEVSVAGRRAGVPQLSLTIGTPGLPLRASGIRARTSSARLRPSARFPGS